MKRPRLLTIAGQLLWARWRWRYLRGARLDRYREWRIQTMVRHADRYAPAYRAHWADHDRRAWRTLPTVDKQFVNQQFAGCNRYGIPREEALAEALRAEQERDFRPALHGLTVGLSSGTSGERGLFLVSRWETLAWAGTILARALPSLRRRYRVAFFLRANSNLYEQANGALIQLRYYDLSTPLPAMIAHLNHQQPNIVIAPPSLLDRLATAQQQGQLHIQPLRLIAVAEILEPHDRDRLSDSFQAPLHQIYQCTEGLLAMSCAHGTLHVQEDLVALQYESLAGLPGEEPPRVTPIVTDLWRRTQPIIRYRLGDLLQLDPQPCRCGSPYQAIAAIEGREADCCGFYGRTGGVQRCSPATIGAMVLRGSEAITDYQVLQAWPGQLDVRLMVHPDTPFATVAASVEAQIAATLARAGCQPASVTIRQGLAPVPASTKRRRVRCLWR